MNYKTYAEAKIANPDSEIYCAMISNDGRGIYGKLIDINMVTKSHYLCNPADHCSSLKDFFDAGFKLVAGDKIIGVGESVWDIAEYSEFHEPDEENDIRFILSVSALNGGCKIPAKAEQWSIYSNTMPLCELTDEQYGKMRRARDNGGLVEFANVTNDFKFEEIGNPNWCKDQVYRIKSKSERELFIEAAIGHAIKPETQSAKQMFGELFDSGKFKYIDNTQHFGENI